MRVPRIYHPDSLFPGGQIALTPEAANHVARVLRLRPGAPLTLFNGEGGEFAATIANVDKKQVMVDVGDHDSRDVESRLAITLVQAVSRGERMDYTIQKAVELGVSRIVPVVSERSVVSLTGERKEKRQQHWSKIVESACQQCGRNRIPEIGEVISLSKWLSLPDDGLRIALDPRGGRHVAELPPVTKLSVLVGPEGGFDDREMEAARSAGYVGIQLGPRILRTETAALVAITVLQSRLGDLG